jgi:hypothetical protein
LTMRARDLWTIYGNLLVIEWLGFNQPTQNWAKLSRSSTTTTMSTFMPTSRITPRTVIFNWRRGNTLSTQAKNPADPDEWRQTEARYGS